MMLSYYDEFKVDFMIHLETMSLTFHIISEMGLKVK